MSGLSIPLTPQVLFYLAVLMIAGATLTAQVSRQFGSDKKRRPRNRRRNVEPSVPPNATLEPAGLESDRELARLQELVFTAERQIGRLEELIRTARTLAPASHSLGETEPKLEPQRQPEPRPSYEAAAPPAETSRRETPRPAHPAATDDPPRMLSLFVGEPSATNSNPRYRELHRLFEAGFSSREISNRLSVPIGEVELVLGLRQHARNLQAGSPPAKMGDAG